VSRHSAVLLLFSIVVVVIIVWRVIASSHAPVELQIDHTTTFFTEPLRSDGTVDYAAAINGQTGHDILPDQNACVVLQRALGPWKEMPAAYYDELGMSALPETGPYLQELELADLMNEGLTPAEVDVVFERYGQLIRQPWQRAEFPRFGHWLDDNEKPLEWVQEASLKPEYYSPLVWDKESNPDGQQLLLSIKNMQPMRMQMIGRILCCRAMLYLGEGDIQAAWTDLLTCRRLARLASRGSTTIDLLCSHQMDEMAYDGMLVLLESSDPDLESLKKYEIDLDQLPAFASVLDVLNISERCNFLDAVCGMAVGKVDGQELIGVDGKKKMASVQTIDWNATLRRANSYYDQFIAAAQLSSHAKRSAASDKVVAPLKDLQSLNGPSVWRSQTHNGNAMADLIATLMLPATKAFHQVETESFQREANMKLVFALLRYRLNRQSYPSTLQELVPEFLPSITEDLFAETSVQFEPQKNGFLFYSVGPNLKDDGGSDNRPSDEDDLTVRFPSQPSKEAPSGAE
jgi:hypothetical protein